MTTKTIILSVGIALTAIACKKQPKACFTADKETATVNSVITFDASCSENVDKYGWLGNIEPDTCVSFMGDAASKTQKIKFLCPGTYKVELMVENGKKSDKTSKTITIN